MTGKRLGSAALGVALGAALGLTSALALGQKPARPPEPGLALRLDDEPGLVLLEPFRHAAGVSATGTRRYLAGRYGRWSAEPWQSLAWTLGGGPPELAVAEDAAAGVEPVAVPVALGLEAAPSFALVPEEAVAPAEAAGEVRWAIPAGPRPWLVPPRYERPRTPAPLGALPPWLRALSHSWAAPLVAGLGCGRGADCSTDAAFPAGALEKLWWALAPKQQVIPDWQCRERPVTIQRFGRESDSLELVRCDGSIPPDALDRLTLLARPAGVSRPDDLLPSEPDPEAAERGEWLPNIRVVHPRLLWVLDAIARQFPWRSIYLYSGYRLPEDDARRSGNLGNHKSQHWEARALDITLLGVSNADLFLFCRDLPDLACGFYPNGKFVHVGVRERGTGGIIWIDASMPNEPARFVDSWPGVVDRGGMVWSAQPAPP